MMSRMGKWIVVLWIGVALAACAGGAPGGIAVSDIWARASGGINDSAGMMTPGSGHMATPGGEMMAGMNSAAYMIIKNNGNQADRLLRVQSDVAQAVELHKSEVVDEVMTMRPVENIEIPAGGEARLEPGGLHVMLIGLKQPLTAGSQITLTLVFENAGEMQVQAEVRAP